MTINVFKHQINNAADLELNNCNLEPEPQESPIQLVVNSIPASSPVIADKMTLPIHQEQWQEDLTDFYAVKVKLKLEVVEVLLVLAELQLLEVVHLVGFLINLLLDLRRINRIGTETSREEGEVYSFSYLLRIGGRFLMSRRRVNFL
jgi:hypothetical protein